MRAVFNYLYITDVPEIAEYVEECGVNRIFVDLELNGKSARQGHLDTVISKHDRNNIGLIKKRLKSADLMVRLNPYYSGSQDEVEMAIDSGCDSIMLPMFDDLETVEKFGELIKGRVSLIPLVETIKGASVIDKVSQLECVSELHIGLNDLHLERKLKFMFQLLSDGTIENLMSRATKPTGFGGIARLGAGMVPGELVMAEHVRLGSSGVILSRAFHNNAKSVDELINKIDLFSELNKLDSLRLRLSESGEAELERYHAELCEKVNMVVSDVG